MHRSQLHHLFLQSYTRAIRTALRPPRLIFQPRYSTCLVSSEPLVRRLPRDLEPTAQLRHIRSRSQCQFHKLPTRLRHRVHLPRHALTPFKKRCFSIPSRCYPCLRTTVTDLPGLYTRGGERGNCWVGPGPPPDILRNLPGSLASRMLQHRTTCLFAFAAFLGTLFHVLVVREFLARFCTLGTGRGTRFTNDRGKGPAARDNLSGGSTHDRAVSTGHQGRQVLLLPVGQQVATMGGTRVALPLAVGTRLRAGLEHFVMFGVMSRVRRLLLSPDRSLHGGHGDCGKTSDCKFSATNHVLVPCADGDEKPRSIMTSSMTSSPRVFYLTSGIPGWSAGRGPGACQKNLRSDSAMATSLMLASRRRIRPRSLNSHSSLP